MKRLAGIVVAVAIVLAVKVWIGREAPAVAPPQAPPNVSASQDHALPAPEAPAAESPAWRARCRELMAYIVRVAGSGALAVEPTLDYFDAITPSPQMPNPPQPDVTGPRRR